MNRNNALHFSIIMLFAWISSVSFGQKISSINYQGKSYFVYPFPVSAQAHSNYYLAVKRPRGKTYSFKQYYIDIRGAENFNKKEFRKVKRKIFFKRLFKKKKKKQMKHLNKRFKKAVRSNPYPLLEQKFSFDSDVVPCLSKIPDGTYIQYFTGVYLVGKNGRGIKSDSIVAGIFTIRNNVLDGHAMWFNVHGDTLKKGVFKNGLKEGEWMVETRRAPYYLSEKDAKMYIEKGHPSTDTTREIITYKDGVKSGKYALYVNSAYPILSGEYANNEQVGLWSEHAVGYSGKGKNRVRNRNNALETMVYTPSSENVVVHQPLIRKRLIVDNDYLEEYNFDSKYEPNVPLQRIFSINFPSEPDIELEEERYGSYEGADYEEEYYDEEYMDEEGYLDEEYYDEEYYDEDFDENYAFKNMMYDRNSGKSLPMAKFIDSLGVVFHFKNVFEKKYPNGQLMVRYEFEDGKLKQESTIYWDNGKPYDVIVFNKDSNQYVQSIYDYNGKLFNELVFDEKGYFVRVNFKPEIEKFINIDGFRAGDRGYGLYYFYDKLDTLKYELTDSLVLFRSWAKTDTSLLYSRSYVPAEKYLTFSSFAISGEKSLDAHLNFSDDFMSWTGYKIYKIGNLSVKTTSSASLHEYAIADTIPQRQMNYFAEDYILTDEHQLAMNGKPFTGKLSLSTNNKSFNLKTGSSIQLNLPQGYLMTNKLMKDYFNYRSSGKTKNEILFNTLDVTELEEDFGSSIYYSLLSGFLTEFVDYPYSENYEYYDYEMPNPGKKVNEKRMSPFTKTIKGQFANGRPQGVWKIYDQFGKIITEIPFHNGEVNGTVKDYDYAYPYSNESAYYENSALMDSVPKRKTHYLYAEREYKNGVPHGKHLEYNWYGEITNSQNYVDGWKEGRAFERNKLAHTELKYQNGALDGYVRTYLTLNKRDSVLLYDLNFKNGMLQGESRAYHTNGKLAKRGFFLNGQPIDDYEAFDTLGFRYHYVKFQYAFPVEEKIWEENELSVRYLFDWRDSIHFQPGDITTSQSLERTLYRLGLAGGYGERPYYGRPTLVNKNGIDYEITKYFPNDTIGRQGSISHGKKVGCWKYYNYDGEFLYEVDYYDTILVLNDSIQFKSKGVLTDYDATGKKLSQSYIIEKFEKYDCSHTDHYEIRQYMTIWQAPETTDRMNGYVKNYYDNGVLQNEGQMKDGLPTGVWKFYDPYGKLNQVGEYVMGKRNGRWLGGDLSKTKYLGDICLNPNLPNLEEEIKYREKLLDIVITKYRMGKALNKEFYDVNMNKFEEEEAIEE